MLFTDNKTSVDSILKVFHKTVQDLMKHANTKNIEGNQHQNQIEVSEIARDAAFAESTKATQVAAKLTEIIA